MRTTPFTAAFSLAALFLTAITTPVGAAPTCAAGQCLAQYYPNTSLSGTPAPERCEAVAPSFNWGNGTPVAGLPVDSFSARWTGSPILNGGNTTFTAVSDDGVRLYVDGTRIINDNWTFHAMTTNSVSRTLAAGTHVAVCDGFLGNSAVTNYRIYRDGLLWNTVAGTTSQDTLVSSGVTYTYTVTAIDAPGNQGPASVPVTVTAQ